MESRRKSTVTVLYSYSYPTSHGEVRMAEGERLILLERSTDEWWQVRRPGDRSQPFYAPANYLHEDGKSRKQNVASTVTPRTESPPRRSSKSDDSLLAGPFSRATGKWSARLVNAELRKQRSTSMDALMFLELLEPDAPGPASSRRPLKPNESLADKLKKPRISKDVWERRKSWAVDEAGPAPRRSDKRHSIAPPLPPRHCVTAPPVDSGPGDKAPALPPKRAAAGSGCPSPAKSASPEHYSRVLAVRSPVMASAGAGRLTESLERLAEQIAAPAVALPVPPRRKTHDRRQEAAPADSPPKLPPKTGKSAPGPMPRAANRAPDRSPREAAKDNYVNLLRPVTVIDVLDDIQSDESGINMSFNNPLFGEKEDATPDAKQQERSGSFNDLDSSSIDERVVLNGSSSSRVGGSESNLSAELDVTYDASSSGEDLLSSKDSINSIPSLRSEQRMATGSLTKKPPGSPTIDDKPTRQLFEGWFEFSDRASGRPFYYNRETRGKSWKPPRKRAAPVIRGPSIEEEPGTGREMGGVGESGASSAAPSRTDCSTDDDAPDGSTTSRPSSIGQQQQQRHRRVVAEAVRSKKLPPAPPGWLEVIEADDVVYVNSVTKARWYTSLDAEGRIYFYEEDSNESLWALPAVVSVTDVAAKCEDDEQEEREREKEEELDRATELDIKPTVYYPEGSLAPPMDKSVLAEPPASGWSMVRGRTSKADRTAKTRSMVLTNFTGRVEDAPLEASGTSGGMGGGLAAKSASLQRNVQPQWPSLHGGSIRVLMQGILHKTKLTENGKKVRKSWSTSWAVLTDLFLFLFKESASKTSVSAGPNGPTLDSTTNKVELCVDLNGATIEWAAVKSSRKGVFQVSTLLGVQLLLQEDDETNAAVWFNEIKRAIGRLPRTELFQEPVQQYQQLPKSMKSPLAKTKSSYVGSSSPTEHKMFDRLGPPVPADVLNSPLSKRKGKLNRTKSTKVPFLGSTEDLTATSPERQTKLRDKLRKFFVRRPPVDTLVKKGIYKDEPVFGCYLSDLCAADKSSVPRFVQTVVQLIESKPENMKADGIYRASGNLSQIQKLRCHVDQYKWAILETEEDVHALTGCLKLFFRELKEPLIPFPLIEQALKAALYQGPQSERIRRYRDVINALPVENYATLKYLLTHLLKITEYRESNRMQISNLAIVFGPTLMWTAIASNNLALDMMQQNIVVEALLNHFNEIFVR